MNYYIDFDNTLFDTPKLTQKMLNAIVKSIVSQKDLSAEKLTQECKSMFNRENIYNIYELAKYFANKYNVNEKMLIDSINYEISNCETLVFDDSINFLKKLKSNGHKIFMLTYCEYGLQYQMAKITGSKLSDLFDGIIVTGNLKYELDIDYSNGIFIDDKPQDLIGLHSKNPKRVIRLRRNRSKYSVKNIENSDIEEYENLNEIPI